MSVYGKICSSHRSGQRQRHTQTQAIRFESKDQAQNAPSPFTTYSLFYNGTFLTNEILSEKKFEKILSEQNL
ncbi:MAG: YoaP domain-containing protein [Blautia coccoides]